MYSKTILHAADTDIKFTQLLQTLFQTQPISI